MQQTSDAVENGAADDGQQESEPQDLKLVLAYKVSFRRSARTTFIIRTDACVCFEALYTKYNTRA